jgi:hypothetical protein
MDSSNARNRSDSFISAPFQISGISSGIATNAMRFGPAFRSRYLVVRDHPDSFQVSTRWPICKSYRQFACQARCFREDFQQAAARPIPPHPTRTRV